MNNYFEEYIEYKQKYLELKNQNGGAIFNVFGNNADSVSAYIYSRDKNGVFYFGFVRKAYNKSRINRMGALVGAAGTDGKYWGKWTNVGGGMDKHKRKGHHHLKAIINELNDETKSNFNSRTVDLGLLNGIKPSLKSNLWCHLAQQIGSSGIFLFEMRNFNEFLSIFPTQGITKQSLLKSSQGEIDAIQSYNMKEIIILQHMEQQKNQNYFISYCLKTFNKIIIPYLCHINTAFKNKWQNISIKYIHHDIISRMPTELLHRPWTT